MTGGDGTGDRPSLPLERYPDPACSYAIVDGQPTVRAANGAFEAAFGAEGSSLLPAFDRPEVAVDAPGGLEQYLEKGGRFTVRVTGGSADATAYAVRGVPPADGRAGRLVFVETGDGDRGAFGFARVASVVSHDLRNPLDVAKARTRAARETDEVEHFEHVEQAHDRMERIIQDVLTLARGEDAIDPDDEVDFGAAAETAWETVETEGATLTVDGRLPTAVADRDRVGRLFENLFRNSVEHGADPDSGDGTGPRVTVGGLEDGFYVADDGSGIPEDERDRVFEPGYSSTDHGTGLGLAIVERIAEAHGWSVGVTSAADGGARFEIRLEP